MRLNKTPVIYASRLAPLTSHTPVSLTPRRNTMLFLIAVIVFTIILLGVGFGIFHWGSPKAAPIPIPAPTPTPPAPAPAWTGFADKYYYKIQSGTFWEATEKSCDNPWLWSGCSAQQKSNKDYYFAPTHNLADTWDLPADKNINNVPELMATQFPTTTNSADECAYACAGSFLKGAPICGGFRIDKNNTNCILLGTQLATNLKDSWNNRTEYVNGPSSTATKLSFPANGDFNLYLLPVL